MNWNKIKKLFRLGRIVHGLLGILIEKKKDRLINLLYEGIFGYMGLCQIHTEKFNKNCFKSQAESQKNVKLFLI